MSERLVDRVKSEGLIGYRADILVTDSLDAVAHNQADTPSNLNLKPHRFVVKESAIKQEGDEQKPVENIVYDKTVYQDFHTLRRLFGVSIKKPFYRFRDQFAFVIARETANQLKRQNSQE
jgi:hypothetical protein